MQYKLALPCNHGHKSLIRDTLNKLEMSLKNISSQQAYRLPQTPRGTAMIVNKFYYLTYKF